MKKQAESIFAVKNVKCVRCGNKCEVYKSSKKEDRLCGDCKFDNFSKWIEETNLNKNKNGCFPKGID